MVDTASEHGGPVPSWRRVHWPTAAWYVVAVVVFLGAVAQFYRPTTGLTYLIDFGDEYHLVKLPAVREAPHYTHSFSVGYDGQFYAQLAVDPLLRDRRLDEAIDTPPYRARRILFSWTAYALGLGQPALILKAYALQNVMAWLGLAMVLLVWLPPTSPRMFVAWFGALYGAGMLLSVRYALLDGPSMLLVALAVLACERGRSGWATGLFAVSGLGRETNLLGATALLDRVPRSVRDLGRLALQGAVMAVPLILWALYVRWVYAGFDYSNVDNFTWPFAGYLGHWGATLARLAAEGVSQSAPLSLAALVSLTTQSAYLVWRRGWHDAWWRLGIVYVVLMAVLDEPVWEGYPGASMRVLLPVAVAFNVRVVREQRPWPWLVAGNLSILQGLAEMGLPLFENWR